MIYGAAVSECYQLLVAKADIVQRLGVFSFCVQNSS